MKREGDHKGAARGSLVTAAIRRAGDDGASWEKQASRQSHDGTTVGHAVDNAQTAAVMLSGTLAGITASTSIWWLVPPAEVMTGEVIMKSSGEGLPTNACPIPSCQ